MKTLLYWAIPPPCNIFSLITLMKPFDDSHFFLIVPLFDINFENSFFLRCEILRCHCFVLNIKFYSLNVLPFLFGRLHVSLKIILSLCDLLDIRMA